MFKTIRKKLNKKGFTLAELLIVVAIIAILVAIAIPIYTGMLERAQIGVNKANARSVKGAAVAQILGDWDVLKAGAKNGSGTGTPGHGWVAEGFVNADGDVEDIKVYIAADSQTSLGDGYVVKQNSNAAPISTGGSGSSYKAAVFEASNSEPNKMEIADSGKLSPEYWVVVYITDVEKIKSGN